MKTHVGSLQKKGSRYYLVVRENGRQRWIALKTGKLPLARLRAARIAPRDQDDETAWLMQLVQEGERARQCLSRLQARRDLTWENLSEACSRLVDGNATEDNRLCHVHWIGLVAQLADKTGASPGSLTADGAAEIGHELAERYLSAPRMMAYLRRVWVAVGLGDNIWPRGGLSLGRPKEKSEEHYRRLSIREISCLYELARKRVPLLADMILLGYSTGLRLSDVAELELAEVTLPFLRVCPNKTRHHKPVPLKIPLTAVAQEVVFRLKCSAERTGARFLFPSDLRHRSSRKITPLFRACGILKEGTGRASFHSLRATFISLMDDAGIPPHVTDSITGHGGGGMHARYTQPSDEALLGAVARAIPELRRQEADENDK